MFYFYFYFLIIRALTNIRKTNMKKYEKHVAFLSVNFIPYYPNEIRRPIFKGNVHRYNQNVLVNFTPYYPYRIRRPVIHGNMYRYNQNVLVGPYRYHQYQQPQTMYLPLSRALAILSILWCKLICCIMWGISKSLIMPTV